MAHQDLIKRWFTEDHSFQPYAKAKNDGFPQWKHDALDSNLHIFSSIPSIKKKFNSTSAHNLLLTKYFKEQSKDVKYTRRECILTLFDSS